MSDALSCGMALARTIPRLGLRNVWQMVLFRWRCRIGFYKRRQPVKVEIVYGGPFWQIPAEFGRLPIQSPSDVFLGEVLSGEVPLFGDDLLALNDPPDWFAGAGEFRDPDWGKGHWSEFFSRPWRAPDIKRLWDPSRFGWGLSLARSAVATGNADILQKLHDWLFTWRLANPVFSKPNWSCGQETSLRLITILLIDALIMETGSSRRVLQPLEGWIREHVCRIEATLTYAIAQRNNHTISEALAIYMAGIWLAENSRCSKHRQYDEALRSQGRRLLESAVTGLISDDGGLPMVSPTYNRVILDLLAIAETWRCQYGEKPLEPSFKHSALMAAKWLDEIIDPVSGDAPNLSGNDGSLFLDWGISDYRDFGSASRRLRQVYLADNHNPLVALMVEPAVSANPVAQKRTVLHAVAGTAVLVGSEKSWALIRFHTGKSRPQHCDSMHVDLWHEGRNLLRDGGSFDYSSPEWHSYFTSCRAHNVIEFDGEDPMLRLSTFLFADWLVAHVDAFDAELARIVISQTDCRGYCHVRELRFEKNKLVIVDNINGSYSTALLRWRLAPDKWLLDSDGVTGPARINVCASVPILEMSIAEGWESRYYSKRSPLPVLEVRLPAGPARIETHIELTG